MRGIERFNFHTIHLITKYLPLSPYAALYSFIAEKKVIANLSAITSSSAIVYVNILE